MKKQGVVIVIQDESGRYLMGKRSLSDSAPGFWIPISGTMEPGETQEQTVVRECREEIGVAVEPVEKVSQMDTPDGRYCLHWWKVRIVNGVPAVMNNELIELRWVAKEDIRSLEPTFPENIEMLLRL